MEQLLLHLFGDFILQTDKQALNKKKIGYFGFKQCFFHCLLYSLPFLLIAGWKAVLIIGITHFLIDRWNIVPYLIAFKNNVCKQGIKHQRSLNEIKDYDISNFGFSLERPFAISVWLMIIKDNSIHLIINYFAIKYL